MPRSDAAEPTGGGGLLAAIQPRELLRDLVAATLGVLLALLLLRYLHDRWMPEWAVVCGGVGGVVTRRLMRPSYASFPRYLRLPLSTCVVTLGTTVATWATLAREPLSYVLLRWREAVTLPLLSGVLGVGMAAVIYTHRRLEREVESRRRMEEDLAVAKRIQKTLLRSVPPALPWMQAHAVNVASREVGGDYYEFVGEGDDTVCFAVGDVSGKGVSAALLMSSLQSAFLAARSIIPALDGVCAHVNRFLFDRTTPERYATFFLGRLSSDGRLRYVNAGHNPPIIVGPRKVRRLSGGGMPLGLFPTATYEEFGAELAADEVLIVYTDGVTEATDELDEEFGEARLIQIVAATRGGSAAEIASGILEAIAAHAGHTGATSDDLTMLVIRCRRPA